MLQQLLLIGNSQVYRVHEAGGRERDEHGRGGSVDARIMLYASNREFAHFAADTRLRCRRNSKARTQHLSRIHVSCLVPNNSTGRGRTTLTLTIIRIFIAIVLVNYCVSSVSLISRKSKLLYLLAG